MRKKIDRKVFARFYHGIASDSEKREIFESRESHNMLKDAWEDATDIMEEDVAKNPDLEQIRKNIRRYSENSKSAGSVRTIFRPWMRYAASILIAISVLTALFYFTGTPAIFSGEVAMIEKSNARGQRSAIRLPDGSRVWLNAESSIQFPEKFNGEKRMVNLTGEAYFEIEHNPEKPFVVHAGDLDISVLGTIFNVKAYSNESCIQTTLISGKVGLSTKDAITEGHQLVMKPNQQATYRKTEQTIELEKVDVNLYTSWRQGRLIFDNQRLSDIVPVLQRWYDIVIDVKDDALLDERYTLTITDESITEVLVLLDKTTNIEYEIDGNNVFLRYQ